MLSRRGIVGAGLAFFAAPAIVRASSLMPVKSVLAPLVPIPATVVDGGHTHQLSLEPPVGEIRAFYDHADFVRAFRYKIFDGRDWLPYNEQSSTAIALALGY